MNLPEIFLKIDSLKAELDKLLPIGKDARDLQDKKFRFEWNYNSNHIEGNTLTYNETELLLIFDKTTGDHDMREYEEMKAHDVAVKAVYEMAADPDRDLNETFIKQLNEVILVRPFWRPAITVDGHDTRRLIDIGTYKKHPNSVRLVNGEMFHYASPEETPSKMSDLLDFYKEQSKLIHPVQLAAILHYRLVRIHPFDDGNGRTARLIMNYVLIQQGYPPVVIKTAGKNAYLMALNKADTGSIDSFVTYIAEQMVGSLNISIDIARGNTVEEVFVKYFHGYE